MRRVSRVIATTVLVGLAGLGIATVLPSPAAAFTSVLRVRNAGFLPWENGVAVDRNGDMFVARSQEFPYAGFDTFIGDRVEMFQPNGQSLGFGRIPGQVRPGFEDYMQGQVAVTPDGRRVIIGGVYSNDGSSSTPYVAEFSTATANFIRGSTLGGSESKYLGPVAVDASGRDIYIAPAYGQRIRRVVELQVANLHRVGTFDLHGAAVHASSVNAITVGGPDGDVYVSVRPHGSSKTLIQVYSAEGLFVRQFFVGHDAGIAVNAVGWVFTGGPHGFDVFGVDGRSRGKTIATPRLVTAEAFDGDGNLYALEFRAKPKGAEPDVIKLRARTAMTDIDGYTGPVSTSPEEIFSFFSDDVGATFECRLLRQGYDAGPFTPCGQKLTPKQIHDGHPNTKIYHNTPNGTYTFQVRAISRDGVIDPSPASYHLKVRTAYAHARITSHPDQLTGDTSPTFTFTADTYGASFRCQIVAFGQPEGAFSPCTSPVTYPGLVHNLYNFQVQAVTPDGYPESPGAEYQFVVDPTPPDVTAPSIGLALGQQLGVTGVVPLSLTWTASDPNTPAGQIVDSLQERSGPSADALGPYATVPGAGGTGNAHAVVAVAAGATRYQFRGQAVNGLGVSGTGDDSAVVRATVVDQDAAAVTYTGGWGAAVSDAAAYDGTVTPSHAAAATATLQFTGSRVGLVVPPGPGRGGLKVCLDPAPATGNGGPCTHVDTSAGTGSERDLIFASDALDDGSHTIQVQTTSSAPVLLDAFVVLK